MVKKCEASAAALPSTSNGVLSHIYIYTYIYIIYISHILTRNDVSIAAPIGLFFAMSITHRDIQSKMSPAASIPILDIPKARFL